MNAPAFGDFGPELNNLLNRLGCFAQACDLDAAAMERLINAGIAAAAQFEPRVSAPAAESKFDGPVTAA